MNKLVFEVNNGRKLELVQMINLYRYCKRYDIKNDCINHNGKNMEV